MIRILLLLLAFPVFAEEAPIDDNIIRTDSTTNSTVTTRSDTSTTLRSPPASAITPTINTSNSDLCTFGVAGAVKTQILGISMGSQITDSNCERLKLSKTLYGRAGGPDWCDSCHTEVFETFSGSFHTQNEVFKIEPNFSQLFQPNRV